MMNLKNERNRLCDLLDEKRDELIMRFPGSVMHGHVMAEIAEIRSWLIIVHPKNTTPVFRILVKRRN